MDNLEFREFLCEKFKKYLREASIGVLCFSIPYRYDDVEESWDIYFSLRKEGDFYITFTSPFHSNIAYKDEVLIYNFLEKFCIKYGSDSNYTDRESHYYCRIEKKTPDSDLIIEMINYFVKQIEIINYKIKGKAVTGRKDL